MESALHPMFAAAAPDDIAASNAAYRRFREGIEGYVKADELGRIDAAYSFAEAAHRGQFRISGDPYITHPLAVAEILTGWRMDPQTLIAALLHDVMEDTAISKGEINQKFGRVAAELVDGVSKLDRIESKSQQDAQAENFRKMLLAMSRDVRVILIKLADRLHNMRTLAAVRPEKRRRIAQETIEIYSPIANRLGLNSLYRELQELAFSHLHPLRFRVLGKAIRAARGNRREVFNKILDSLKRRLAEAGIDAEVQGREKHLFSIYRKMRVKHLSFSQVLDIYGFRVIVSDVPSCYLALGALHGMYKPVPGKFKDYIAIPKANGYQSLHTTLIGPFGTPVEVQIRTREMHHVAETGVASHWLYDNVQKPLSELQRKTNKWLQSLLELQSMSLDSREFLDNVKTDLFPGEIFVFTPRGKILALPRGATAVDFAYAVHTDIGNRCESCSINQNNMPLSTQLKNGDQVEIVTNASAKPDSAWLTHAKTGKARSQIRHYLKTTQVEASTALGEQLLEQALQPYGLRPNDIAPAAWDKFLRDGGVKSKPDLLMDIGLGKRLAAIVARRLAESSNRKSLAEGPRPGSIVIRGTEGVAVQLAGCCKPIPGDAIVGVIKKGQGLVVHRGECASIARAKRDRDKFVDVEWKPEPGRLFDAGIHVVAANQRGVLAKVAAEIAESDSNIQNVSMDEEHGAYSTLHFTLQVTDRGHLARIMRSLHRLPEVSRLSRLKEEWRTN